MRWLVIVLVVILAVGGVIKAQTTLDSGEYWQRLAETDALLRSGQSSERIREQISGLWDEVESVRLPNEDVIPVDTGWLVNDRDLDRMQQRVTAALAARQADNPQTVSDEMATLADVLRDERFQYDDEAPEPQPQPIPQGRNQPLLSLSLSQILLAALGTIIVLALIISIARQLNIQRYQPAPIDPDDDPTTSEDAQERAAESETVRDYRAAIRYLYLSSLLLLDERDIIHYDSSQTNVEHLRQLHDRPQLYDLLKRIVDTFDRVWYGFSPVDESGYRQFRQNIQQLESLTTA